MTSVSSVKMVATHETENKYCFHCVAPDITAEVDALGEAMSELEQKYVLEHCRKVDLKAWIGMFQ